jgi:putative sugar O-methyltransferase
LLKSTLATPSPRPTMEFLRNVVTGDVAGLAHVLPRLSSDPSLLARYAALAAANGQLEILQRLHQNGADILAEEQLPLRLAAACGWIPVVDYLVEHGATPHRYGDELVKAAARAGYVQMLARLQALGCNPKACMEIIEELVNKPSLEPVLNFLRGEIPDGLPLARLIAAIRHGSRNAVAAALVGNDLKAHAGLLLETAARTGSTRILRYLYESGADLAPVKKRVMQAAAETGHYDVLHRLISEYGCDPGSFPEAAVFAAENGHIECLTLLWTSGGAKTAAPRITLQLAALNGHEETHDYLTHAGGMDGIAEHRETVRRMVERIMAAPPIYRPSELWKFFNEVNLEQLRRFGMPRFKRSVNQNYLNFLPIGLRDPQLRGLLWHFAPRFPIRTVLGLRMTDPDRYAGSGRLATADARVFRLWNHRPKYAALGRFVQKVLYRLLVGMLWRYAELHDELDLRHGLQEPALGGPIVTATRDRPVSQDLAHSILECNAILAGIQQPIGATALRIAEIGAGYGRVGDVLLSGRGCRYFVFDIPPGLLVSQWYLSQRYSHKRIFRFRDFERFDEVEVELQDADIAFFTPDQIEKFPDGYFDIVINISSLHEMRHEQMRYILEQMYRISGERVYIKQYRHYLNPWDKIEVSEKNYSVPSDWKKKSWRADPVDDRFFEAVLERSRDAASARRLTPAPKAPKRPTVSILLANYNDGRYLHTSLEAILSQTDPADEVIVVDDGSTDDSIRIIESMLPRHHNARLVRQERNRGQHAAIQRALLEATSDYIVWASSDDLLLPRFIERSREVLAKYPGCGICFSRLCAWREGTRDGTEYSESNHGPAFDLGASAKYYSPDDLRGILRNHYLWISGNTVLARRELLIEMGGFDLQLRWHADWFSFYAIALRAGACGIPETLAMMRERAETYSRSGMKNRAQQKNVLRLLLDTLKEPRNRDLLVVFRESPSLLSLFGRAVVLANLWRLQHWDLIPPVLVWHLRRRFVVVIRNQLDRCRVVFIRIRNLLHRCRVVLIRIRNKLRRWRSGRARSP